jgi:hypothetical protein
MRSIDDKRVKFINVNEDQETHRNIVLKYN